MRAKRSMALFAGSLAVAGMLSLAPAAIPEARAADHVSTVAAGYPGPPRWTDYSRGYEAGARDGRREAVEAARDANCLGRGSGRYGRGPSWRETEYDRGYQDGYRNTYDSTLRILCHR
ncbi:hypothetical protein ORV05_16170 [Amycolatopsis cynarae]|uniref:Uncharacterized protein n=1 Tax=Amycolatopsis cynarae TaxID=2995223 RepID=A0ABY7BA49_9PSEU|nr:hypothetical protein [Amycolatopsis sp. HUAS 11-8]WAL69235.1 hypothetical protein ORV05_16170 [Amycolatopsis sp. HUAS 11-8]